MNEARHPARDAFERLYPIALQELSKSDRRHIETRVWPLFAEGWDAHAEHAMQTATQERGE